MPLQGTRRRNLPSRRSRAHWLQAELERHNELYYVEARPEITDQEFDQLLHELESLENQYPSLRTSESPTQSRGGRPIDEFQTVEHRIPMQSMDNTYSIEELCAFDERVRKILKMDKPSEPERSEDTFTLSAATKKNPRQMEPRSVTRRNRRSMECRSHSSMRMDASPARSEARRWPTWR